MLHCAVKWRNRQPSPEGRIENSPPFQGWDCGRGISRPEGTAESIRGFRPSLRDLGNSEHGPGSELPGYFRFSLREKGSVSTKWQKSRSRASPWAYFLSPLRGFVRAMFVRTRWASWSQTQQHSTPVNVKFSAKPLQTINAHVLQQPLRRLHTLTQVPTHCIFELLQRDSA